MLFSELPPITGGQVIQQPGDPVVTTLLTDSRKLSDSQGVIFFAIRGERHDGHRFVSTLYERGVRMFIVEEVPPDVPAEACMLVVSNAIEALQRTAAHHRKKFRLPVLGLTGSNGKTIIKEWLYQLLAPDFKVAKNPASYNSQIGVPLSVWQIGDHHTLGIFEAGISTVG